MTRRLIAALPTRGLGDSPIEPGPQREAHQTQCGEREDETAAGAGSELSNARARQDPNLAAAATAAADVAAARLAAATGRGVRGPRADGIADRDRVAGIAAAVDIFNGDGAPVCGCGRHPSIARAGGVGLQQAELQHVERLRGPIVPVVAVVIVVVIPVVVVIVVVIAIAAVVIVVARVGHDRKIPSSTAGIADAGAAIGDHVEDGGVLDNTTADGDTEITAAALGGIDAGGRDGTKAHHYGGRHGYRKESRAAHGAFSIQLAGRFRPLATHTCVPRPGRAKCASHPRRRVGGRSDSRSLPTMTPAAGAS